MEATWKILLDAWWKQVDSFTVRGIVGETLTLCPALAGTQVNRGINPTLSLAECTVHTKRGMWIRIEPEPYICRLPLVDAKEVFIQDAHNLNF